MPALAGRTALITGVSRRKGIGFALADRLARDGADVFVQHHAPYDAEQSWGAEHDGPEALMEALRQHGTRIEGMAADFFDAKAPGRVVEAAREALGPLDILIANHAHSTRGTLDTLTAEQVDRHLVVNVRGSLLLAQAFAAQHDDARTGGRIVLMTSGQHLGPMPGELAYVASKGALHQLTQSLAVHLASRGITVNTVNPGATDTGWASSDEYEAVKAAHPQGRWGTPEDAARLIAWLVSDEAAWITGQVLNSTGGWP